MEEEVGEQQGEGPGARCGGEGPDFASLPRSPPSPAWGQRSSGLRNGRPRLAPRQPTTHARCSASLAHGLLPPGALQPGWPRPPHSPITRPWMLGPPPCMALRLRSCSHIFLVSLPPPARHTAHPRLSPLSAHSHPSEHGFHQQLCPPLSAP